MLNKKTLLILGLSLTFPLTAAACGGPDPVQPSLSGDAQPSQATPDSNPSESAPAEPSPLPDNGTPAVAGDFLSLPDANLMAFRLERSDGNETEALACRGGPPRPPVRPGHGRAQRPASTGFTEQRGGTPMNSELISLSPSEWRVMEVLWQGDATLMELVHALGGSGGWAKSTVTTMVRRMEAKGLITHQEGPKAKLFHAAVGREEVAAAETDSLLSRVYQGSVGLMVNTLFQRGSLSKEDIDELYAILEQAEENQNH